MHIDIQMHAHVCMYMRMHSQKRTCTQAESLRAATTTQSKAAGLLRHAQRAGAWRRWRQACRESQRLRWLGEWMVSMRADQAVAAAWAAWCQRLRSVTRVSKMAAQCGRMRAKRLLRAASTGWASWANDERRVRAIGARVCLRWQGKGAVRAFSKWQVRNA